MARAFIRLVAIAFLIAAPIAWWLMHRWLSDYAERITKSWTIFAGVGVFTAVIAIAAIGHQAIRAAMINPVKALRAE
jgi:putative ABC transport system permease protein